MLVTIVFPTLNKVNERMNKFMLLKETLVMFEKTSFILFFPLLKEVLFYLRYCAIVLVFNVK